MRRENWYISTIDENAKTVAGSYGLGIEIAEFCTAWNMDLHFDETDASVRKTLEGHGNPILHGPFNELFPCAIDPKARELAAQRYLQAIQIADGYGAQKIVIHAGYNPKLYYPVWYTEQSILFWKDFLQHAPENMIICLENVFEEEIPMFLEILQQVDDPRLKICLDIGHVHAYSKIPVSQWVKECAPYISHFHMHNNDGCTDFHQNLQEGKLDIKALLQQIEAECPDATFTIETTDTEPSVKWLIKEGIL